LNQPLALTVASAVASWAVLLAFHLAMRFPVLRDPWVSGVWAAAGLAYAQLFEYLSHDLAMHRGVRGLGFVLEGHIQHHRVFRGGNFRSRDPKDLCHVTLKWYAFPLLLSLHYALLAVFALAAAPAFFAGVTAHFVIYETCHWFTHVDGNGFDRVLSRVPLVAAIRAAQIRHHKVHHQQPSVNYNFTPPYAGDRIAGTLLRPVEAPPLLARSGVTSDYGPD